MARLDQGVAHGAQRVTLADAGQAERQDIGRRLEKRPRGELFQALGHRWGEPPGVERLERLAGRQPGRPA